jgi:hypothetical protein
MRSAQDRTAARDVHCAIFEIMLASFSLWKSWQGFRTFRCPVSKKKKKLPRREFDHIFDDHGRSNETFRAIHRRFWWNSLASIRKTVRDVCHDCVTCSTQKSMRHSTYFQPKPIDVGHMPFQVISIDPKPVQQLSSQGHDSLLCIVDRFSGWTIAVPHMKTDSAEELARILDLHVYTIFGCPCLILSECDTKFHSEVFQAVQKRRGATVSL